MFSYTLIFYRKPTTTQKMKTTEKKITKMLHTQKLRLPFWQKLDYFRSIYVVMIVAGMLITPLALLKITSGYLMITTLSLVASYWLFNKLRSGLSFKEIPTNLSQNENYIKIRNTFEAMNVDIDDESINWLVGRTNKLLNYAGERISVINTDGFIYVNSISPRGGLRFRANKQNIKIFEQYFYLE